VAGGVADPVEALDFGDLADQGRDAEVRIFLRDGALGGAFAYPARPPLAWAS